LELKLIEDVVLRRIHKVAMRKRTEMKRGPKKNLKRVRERCWKKLHY